MSFRQTADPAVILGRRFPSRSGRFAAAVAGGILAGVILGPPAWAGSAEPPVKPKPAAAALAVRGGTAPAKSGDWSLCRKAAAAVEARISAPPHFLSAVTLTETGRSGPDRKLQAWPWTINVGGKGYVFAGKKEAVNAVRRLMAQGHRSIDVGCMQVNLKYHPRAFTSLEEAFDPASNLAYGADFLVRLKKRHGTWGLAVQHYHSYTEEHRERYAARFNTLWALERKRMAKGAGDAKKAQSALRQIGARVSLAGMLGIPRTLVRAALAEFEPAPAAVATLTSFGVSFGESGETTERHTIPGRFTGLDTPVLADSRTGGADGAAPVAVN